MSALGGRRAFRVAAVLLMACSLACSHDPTAPDPVSPLPLNDTPQHTVQRLIWACENKNAQEYGRLFTGDFTFEFSVIDPTLRQKWSAGWFKQDEVIMAQHLFTGGTNLAGQIVHAASSIVLVFADTQPLGDTTVADTTRYKVLSTAVDGAVIDSVSGTSYILSGGFHRFHVVRGDAAVGLSELQPADSTHWYIWKWTDLTGDLAAKPETETRTSTWGEIKGAYR